MTLTSWKHRISVLVALATLGAFTADAFAQYQSRPERRGRKYKVSITSMPTGATIYLDDKKYGPIGMTPWEGRLQKGEWLVIVEKAGYKPAMQRIEVRRTRRLQENYLPLQKAPNPPKVDISAAADANVAGANVRMDGLDQGKAPMQLKVSAGRHLIEVTREGYKPFSRWIEVKEGQTFTLSPKLAGIVRARTGSILIEADVADAEVYIDGKRHKDATPTLIDGLSEGAHIVEVRKRSFVPWRKTVTIKDGETVKLAARLNSAVREPGGTIRVESNAPGAQVSLDGTPRGAAPIDLKDLKPGEHVIEVSAPNHLTRSKRVMVGAGSGMLLTLELQPLATTKTGILIVVSPLPDSVVFVDGTRLGIAPQQKELPAGAHQVSIRKPGFRTFEKRVILQGDKKLSVKGIMDPVGSLRVMSVPLGAAVWLDGQLIGTTPVRSDEVTVGEHVIQMTKAGFYDYQKTFKVQGGRRTVINGTLKEIR